MAITRRQSLLFMLAACTAAATHATESYPSRTVTVVVPYAAGGTTDMAARLIAEEMARTLKTTVIVENKPGASAIVGASYVARAKPDGYTLLLGTGTVFSTNPSLLKDLPYKVTDFVPIGTVARLPYVLTVGNQIPVTKPTEFVRWASEQPDGVTYSTIGVGSANHLLGLLIAQRANLRMIDVPYKGNAPANADLIGGVIDSQIDGLNGALPLHQAGRARIVGILDAERWPGLDVPTFAESGYPDLVGGSWLAMAAPAGTPLPIVTKLSEAVKQAVSNETVREKLTQSGQVPMPMSQAETAAFLKGDHDRWERVIREANIKID